MQPRRTFERRRELRRHGEASQSAEERREEQTRGIDAAERPEEYSRCHLHGWEDEDLCSQRPGQGTVHTGATAQFAGLDDDFLQWCRDGAVQEGLFRDFETADAVQKANAVERFTDITGTDREVAERHLAEAGGNLEAALQSYTNCTQEDLRIRAGSKGRFRILSKDPSAKSLKSHCFARTGPIWARSTGCGM